MSYQVLARKWRPQSFADIVGQEHVVRALINALKSNRLHHAYLFSGTRGVGKTTIARILAKALNCETGVTHQPCGQCDACVEITEGRCIDLIEVDAASRTKVEDTRELLDNVQYAPTRARYKIYLIDEVHMLSGHSFNALLKTLEEPPEHVKFLLATTDPQKLPVTVLSRCLQFNLTHLSIEQIKQQIIHILSQEGIAANEHSAHLIARAADGSMRDALSLLDQAIAYTGNDLSEENVGTMLGLVPRARFAGLVEHIIQCDARGVMECVDQLAQLNVNFTSLLEELGSVFNASAIQQMVADVDTGTMYPELAGLIADQLTAEDIQLHYQLTVRGLQDIQYAHTQRAGFEMTVLRMMLFRPDNRPAVPKRKWVNSTSVTSSDAKRAVHSQESKVPAKVKTEAVGTADWNRIIGEIQAEGVVLALAEHTSLKDLTDQRIVLELAAEHKALKTRNAVRRLNQLLNRYFDSELQLEIIPVIGSVPDAPATGRRLEKEQRMDHARESIMEDEFIRGLQNELQAELIPNSIKTNDEEVSK